MITNQKMKEALVKYAHMMEAGGFGNSYEGNISARDGDLVYISPSRTRKATLTADKVAVVDMDGNQVDGPIKPSTELAMHLACYKTRPDAQAVIHSHSLYLNAYAMCHKDIDYPISHEFLALFKKIPCAAYGRAGTDAIYADAVRLLKTYDCVLLANHGSLLVAKTLDSAFARLEAAEGLARIFTVAHQIGTPVALPPEEIEFFLKKIPAN